MFFLIFLYKLQYHVFTELFFFKNPDFLVKNCKKIAFAAFEST